MGCGSTSRIATSVCSRDRVATYEARDSISERLVMLYDTITETTTITVDRNEVGDTIFRSVVTDKTRAASRNNIARQTTKTVVKTDTVYIATRDSVVVQKAQSLGARASPFVSSLKWIFLIIVSLIVLIVVIKFLK